MTVIGFTFSKISIERKAAIPQKVEIKSKINVKNISKHDVKLVTGKDTLKFDFTYKLEYAPDLAHVNFEGHLLVVLEPAKAEEVAKEWKKSKQLDEKIKFAAYNAIFHKCNVKAFELEEDFNLPLHLRLPEISPDQVKK